MGRRAGVFVPVLLAVTLRLALVALAAPEQQRVFNSDSYQYDRLARNLLDHGRFTRDTEPPFRPEGMRTPLFPALAAVLYAALGRHYAVVLVADALLAGLTAFLLARASPVLGPTAALLFALDPTSIVYSALFVAEILFTLLLLAGVLLLARALDGRGRWLGAQALGSGLVLGLAVLAKPAATYLPLALLLAAVLVRGRRIGLGKAAALLLAGYAAVVGPWLLRNRAAFGVAETSSIQEVNLLYWNVGVLEGDVRGLDHRSAQQALLAEAEARAGRPLEALADAERTRLLRTLAVEKIRAHPLRYAWIHLRGALATLADPGRLDYARLLGGRDWSFGFLSALTAGGLRGALAALAGRPPALVLLLGVTLAWLLLLLGAALLGVVRLRGALRHPLFCLALAAAAYLAVIGGPIGNARFRVPLVPYLALLAAAGLEREGSGDGDGEGDAEGDAARPAPASA